MRKPSPPSTRSPLAEAGGCIVAAVFLMGELMLVIGITGAVITLVKPALQARGYNTNVGTGFMIPLCLGLVVSIYPVLWVDRLRRRLGG